MILGLDLSSTATGVCLDGECSVIKQPSDKPILDRARVFRSAVSEYIRSNHPQLVVLEALGTRMTDTAIKLTWVHALVLDAVDCWSIPVVTVTPAQLKKFATGKGNADKVQMAMAAQRCGYDGPENDNAIDAWWLWAIGAYGMGTWRDAAPVTTTAYRLAVVDALAWPEVVK